MTRRLLFPPLLLLAACGGATGPDPGTRRVVGVVDVGGGSPRSRVAPDTVAAGAPFTVTVATFGSSSCTRADGAELQVRGLVAEIVPYDREAAGPVACTDDLRPFPRDVAVRFAGPGQGTVRVLGRGSVLTRAAEVDVRRGEGTRLAALVTMGSDPGCGVVLLWSQAEKTPVRRGRTAYGGFGRAPGWRRGRAAAP
jgi:hypothetical protein